jgi:chemotaxis protein MotB
LANSSRSRTKVVKDNNERYLLTYADLMNLLLILFIVLYTMSKVDIDRYQTVAASLRSVFGIGSGSTRIIGEGRGGGNSLLPFDTSVSTTIVPALLEQQQIEEIQETVSDIVEQQGLSGSVEVSAQERGLVISISEKVLFASGSADIDPESIKTVEKIGQVLLNIPEKHIRIEGHTDTDPIKSSRFPDNHELSTARANSVLRILVNRVGIDPRIISATGYGEYRPVAPNDTPENKAKNRRVDITILKDIYEASESRPEEIN